MRLSQIVRRAQIEKVCGRCGDPLPDNPEASTDGVCGRCRKALLGDDFNDPNGTQMLTTTMTRRPIAPIRVPSYY